MDQRIQELITLTKEKFGLEDYYLERHSLFRNVNLFHDTSYTLSMEWFPNHNTEQEDDELNPDGTAVIDIDVNSRKYKSAIFVSDQTYAKNGVVFANQDKRDIIDWIERETGLTYEKQFQLYKEVEGELSFKACFKGIEVAPSGFIEIKYNQEGNLTLFSVDGPFPLHDIVKEEIYSLSLEEIKHLAKEQLKLVEFPSFDQKKITSVYAVEEVYVTNDRTSTLPFDIHVDVGSHLKVNETIYWDESIVNKPFERVEISLTENITIEQAFSKEPSPVSRPITKLEKEQCVIAVKNVLHQEYPSETGKWLVETLHREKGYIVATLRSNVQNLRLFKRKLLIFIDANSLQAINYFDNQLILQEFDRYEVADTITITKEAAYEKMKDLIELKPYYVYDCYRKQYVLSGKVDCHFAVDAENGKVIALKEL